MTAKITSRKSTGGVPWPVGFHTSKEGTCYVEYLSTCRAFHHGRAAVATLTLGGLAVAGTGDSADADPLIAAVEARRRLQARIEAFSDAMPPGASEDDPVEVEFNRLCDKASESAWRLLEIEATSVAGVIAFLALVSDFTHPHDEWPARKDDEGKYVTFEADALGYAARALTRLTGEQANV